MIPKKRASTKRPRIVPTEMPAFEALEDLGLVHVASEEPRGQDRKRPARSKTRRPARRAR